VKCDGCYVSLVGKLVARGELTSRGRAARARWTATRCSGPRSP